MGFDLAELDTKTLADKGVPMPVLNPRTRLPMLNDDKSPVTITMHGRNSIQFITTLAQVQTTRGEMSNRGETISARHQEEEDIATLIACTANWTIQTLDGKPFPPAPENVTRLWNDERFRSLRRTTMAFVLDDGNFLVPASVISGGGHGSNSSSAAHSLTAGRSETSSEATA